jgi:Protoglobin
MTQNEPIQGVESRYKLYGLDAEARSAIKKLWPAIAPHLDKAVEAILDATGQLPHLAQAITQHRGLLKEIETSHLVALINGDLDSRYFESCRRTVEQEAALGIDGRFRSTAGNYV